MIKILFYIKIEIEKWIADALKIIEIFWISHKKRINEWILWNGEMIFIIKNLSINHQKMHSWFVYLKQTVVWMAFCELLKQLFWLFYGFMEVEEFLVFYFILMLYFLYLIESPWKSCKTFL